MRGYFAIGIENTKNVINVGGLLRSAQAFGADYVFTIGKRYNQQPADTTKAWRHLPLFKYASFEDFYEHLPFQARLIGVEIDTRARKLPKYTHPDRAIYLLGAEDHGLSNVAISKCHDLIEIPGIHCLNVHVAGSLVMYDRVSKVPETEQETK